MILAVLDDLGRGLDDRADCDCNDVVSRKWEEEEYNVLGLTEYKFSVDVVAEESFTEGTAVLDSNMMDELFQQLVTKGASQLSS